MVTLTNLGGKCEDTRKFRRLNAQSSIDSLALKAHYRIDF